MNRYVILYCCVLLAVLILPATILAQGEEEVGVTLINGAVVKGNVIGCTEAGIEIKSGQASRTFPWYALAPGSRFRYDAHYRMNAQGYLNGSPANALTNGPDPDYDPMNPETWAVAEKEKPEVKSSGLNFAKLITLSPINPSDLFGFSSSASNQFSCWAMQYGPTDRDVVLFGFPGDDARALYSVNKGDGRLVTESATPLRLGDIEYLSFAKNLYRANIDDVAAEMSVQWLVATNDASRRILLADVSLSSGGKTSTFTLQGTPLGITAGIHDARPRPLLVEPALSFTIQTEGDKTYLVGQVRMSRLNLLPQSDMDSKVAVTISDARGRVEIKQDVAFQADLPPGDFPLRLDVSKLSPGQAYTVSATIFLGYFFDKITYEDSFVMLDAGKL